MDFSIPEFLSDEHSLGVFLLVTVLMGGGAAWLAGRAIAATWRHWWHLALYMVVLSPWLLGERLRREDLIVMAAVAVGLALVLAGHDAPVATAPDPARGNVLAALSGLTWALTVCGLHWVGDEARGGSAVPSVVLGNALAFLAALPFALPLGASRAVDWAVIAYLGIFQIGVAYLLVSSGLRQVTAIEASILLLVEPALNPFFAWLVHGEKPSAFAMAGGLIILGATTLRTWIDARSPVAEAVGAAP